ncbi:MAG: DUF6671 family protein [bacterium]|nr:DUF6671 family protein [bacterium]
MNDPVQTHPARFSASDPWSGQTVVLGTMHGKEVAIAPAMASLGLHLVVPPGFDTDRFGTFTREIPRAGDQIEAARAKARAALDVTGASLALASEGSFGPHPAIPWIPANREIVLLLDARDGREYRGMAVSTKTCHEHAVVHTLAEAEAFAARLDFPRHALVARAGTDEHAPLLARGIARLEDLREHVSAGLRVASGVFLEVDLRAHLNPTRMAVIAEAARDLVRVLAARCPACGSPGFVAVARVPGLPCGDCGLPTRETLHEVLACEPCGASIEQRPQGASSVADPGRCDACNP